MPATRMHRDQMAKRFTEYRRPLDVSLQIPRVGEILTYSEKGAQDTESQWTYRRMEVLDLARVKRIP